MLSTGRKKTLKSGAALGFTKEKKTTNIFHTLKASVKSWR